MILTLSPFRGLPGQPETTLAVAGDILTVDGFAFDLSPIPEGAEATATGEHPFVGPIRRIGGVIHAALRVRLGDNAASHQPVAPGHWSLAVGDGPVDLPVLRKPQPTMGEIE